MTARLKEKYEKDVRNQLRDRFGYKNPHQIPKLDKVVINMSVSEAITNPKALDAAASELQAISGQKPVIAKAKKSIAAFKLREGVNIAAKVTLRGERMYVFLDKLFNVTLPRVRDFGGISPNSFDGHGNFAMGMREQHCIGMEHARTHKKRRDDPLADSLCHRVLCALRAALESAGCEVHEYEGSEISVKGDGGPTCLTAPIWRTARS